MLFMIKPALVPDANAQPSVSNAGELGVLETSQTAGSRISLSVQR